MTAPVNGDARAPLSVIIPTRDAMGSIGPTLQALMPGVAEGLVREVLFADGGSRDGVETVAAECGARLVQSRPGRGVQLQAGAAAAHGDWLLFLHADTVLAEHWWEAVRMHIRSAPATAACFRLRFRDGGVAGWWVAGWANLRSRVLALPYGDQGLLVSADLYHACGGYPGIVLMEDVALVRRLGRRRLRTLPCDAVTDPVRYRREGWLWRGGRNLLCLLAYLLGAHPDRIAAFYLRSSGQPP